MDMQYTLLLKLKKTEKKELIPIIKSVMLPEEKILGTFKSLRNFVVFTTERIIEICVHGTKVSKYDFMFVPYNQISVYSLKNANTNTPTMELNIRCSNSAMFEFVGESETVMTIINTIAKTVR